jgi:hypothetical protein
MRSRVALVWVLTLAACGSSGGNTETGGAGGGRQTGGAGGTARGGTGGKGGGTGGAAGGAGAAGTAGATAGGAGASGGAAGSPGGGGGGGASAAGAGGAAGSAGAAGAAGGAAGAAGGAAGAAGGAAGKSLGGAGGGGRAGASGGAGSGGAAGEAGAGGAKGAAGAGGAAGGAGAAGSGSGGRAGDGGAPDGGVSSLCAASPGALVWGGAPSQQSGATAVDIATGPGNDTYVAGNAGGSVLWLWRWDAAGRMVFADQNTAGSLIGQLFSSGLWVDPNDDAFYGLFFNSAATGPTETYLYWYLATPNGSQMYLQSFSGYFSPPYMPAVGTLQVSGDAAGNAYGAFTMTGQQIVPSGDYGYSPTGTALGVNAANVTGILAPQDFLWSDRDGNLVLFKAVTSTTEFGCGLVTVPATGGVVLGKFTGSGSCIFSQLLALPTAAVKATNFRVGADGSLLAAAVYSGTISFGGAPLTSSGTSSLAIAGFDGAGHLIWDRSFGGGGAGFTIGSLGANAAGTVILTGGYAGSVDLGGGALPTSADTFLMAFDPTHQYKWSRTVSVGANHRLLGAASDCGFMIATDSDTVDFGQGPLFVSVLGSSNVGVAALGL